MKPVEYDLYREGKRVYFQVKFQPKCWMRRNYTKYELGTLKWECEKTGISVYSAGHPEINNVAIFLRGTDQVADNDTVSWMFRSIAEAKLMLKTYADTLSLFNEYLATLESPEENFFA